ncbi:MAG TPA: hypothetical protein DDW27_03630 [Bacteroidales bacterium]|nr:hypothetical protein [Bacteroidales bacterium]
MVLLQIITDSLNSLQTDIRYINPWFITEILLISSVIIWQLFLSGKIYIHTKQLKGIFKYPLKVRNGYIDRKDLSKKEKTIDDIVFVNDEGKAPDDLQSGEDFVKISVTEAFGSEIIIRIRDYINTYLLNNYGAAVNFSIIKDFIDRETDVKDEEISHSLPTPLYLGLASTMIGIICGLFAMPALDGGRFGEGIDALINGVKLAMLGSLSGLTCTTILTSFHYKSARKSLLKDKNNQISYLQAKLLPELIKAEDTGVAGLKGSLDRFARIATDISGNILKAADQTGSNILLQQDVIRQVANLDILKISEANLELFRRLENNMATFEKFSGYISDMSRISENLKDFAGRTSNIDNIINQINQSLQDNIRLSQFLTSHFEKIEISGINALKAVDLANSSFNEAIEKLENEISRRETILNNAAIDADKNIKDVIENLHDAVNNRITLMNKNEADFETKLAEIYLDISRKFQEIGDEYIRGFQSVYSNSVPRFKHLDKLDHLPEIKESVSANIEGINKLISSVNSLTETLSNNDVLKKLDLIEEHLRKRRSGIIYRKSLSVASEGRQVNLWKRFQKQVRLFRQNLKRSKT